jgi:hypothetical protein
MNLGDCVCNLLLQVQQKVVAAGSWSRCMVEQAASHKPDRATSRRAVEFAAFLGVLDCCDRGPVAVRSLVHGP